MSPRGNSQKMTQNNLLRAPFGEGGYYNLWALGELAEIDPEQFVESSFQPIIGWLKPCLTGIECRIPAERSKVQRSATSLFERWLYCDVASQCGWIYWSLILRDVVYNAANVCEPHFVTGKQCAWWKILWRLSGKRCPHRSFAEL